MQARRDIPTLESTAGHGVDWCWTGPSVVATSSASTAVQGFLTRTDRQQLIRGKEQS